MSRLTIVVDTREKRPYPLRGYRTVRKALQYGDYSAIGLISVLQIERKSIADMLGSLTTKWEGFSKKLFKWRHKHRLIMIEGSIGDVWKNRYCTPNMHGVIQERLAVMCAAGIVPMFAGDRKTAEALTVKCLRNEKWYAARVRPV